MPLKGWIHPLKPNKVPFDHFDTDRSDQGRPAANPWMARAAALGVEKDVRHAGLDTTATRCLGCPRQVYIETMFDYWLRPDKLELRTRGTALHHMAESMLNPDLWYTEATDPVKMTIDFILGGHKVSMKADAIRRDLTEIIDFKFPMDFSISRREKQRGVAKADHIAQLNMARIGLAQQQWAIEAGYNPDKVLLTLWDHAIGKNAGTKGLVAPHVDEAELLAYRPGGAEYSVEQIIAMLEWAQAEHTTAEGNELVETRERIASQIPLVGRPMFNASKCREYCDVEPICTKIASKYGEPAPVEFEND